MKKFRKKIQKENYNFILGKLVTTYYSIFHHFFYKGKYFLIIG